VPAAAVLALAQLAADPRAAVGAATLAMNHLDLYQQAATGPLKRSRSLVSQAKIVGS
jgi:hypothetical protein